MDQMDCFLARRDLGRCGARICELAGGKREESGVG
jgi:hypothetical protein